MSVLSSGSSKDIDYLEDDHNTPIASGGLPLFANHHREGKLKVVSPDINYQTFSGLGPAEIYDKICSLVHFGHISNRILRKMIHAGFLDASCGSVLGKNRKTRTEQRKMFDSLSTQGVIFLHKIIKSELEGSDLKDDASIIGDKLVGSKRPVDTSSSTSAPPATVSRTVYPSMENRKFDHFSKSELIEAIREAFHSSKAIELTQAMVAKENATRNQNSIKFLQDQLKEGNKLTAAKKKEFEMKLEELLSSICEEL